MTATVPTSWRSSRVISSPFFLIDGLRPRPSRSARIAVHGRDRRSSKATGTIVNGYGTESSVGRSGSVSGIGRTDRSRAALPTDSPRTPLPRARRGTGRRSCRRLLMRSTWASSLTPTDGLRHPITSRARGRILISRCLRAPAVRNIGCREGGRGENRDRHVRRPPLQDVDEDQDPEEERRPLPVQSAAPTSRSRLKKSHARHQARHPGRPRRGGARGGNRKAVEVDRDRRSRSCRRADRRLFPTGSPLPAGVQASRRARPVRPATRRSAIAQQSLSGSLRSQVERGRKPHARSRGVAECHEPQPVLDPLGPFRADDRLTVARE